MANSKTSEVKIAALVLNWNKKNELISLLNDLSHIKEPIFDIFVVDNASQDKSVEAVRLNFPKVNIFINSENLGGTGGFNSGIIQILKNVNYEYIWLLDNDVRVISTTLEKLLKVIESDPKIGMVGSRILDIDSPRITVETGSSLRWDMIGVDPLNRNVTGTIEETIEVDYVAICSAIVRVEAIKKVGLMDQRFFLLWDDMEWGLSFKERGYKVLAAADSIVYHASFTERARGTATNFYYGIRNPLLVYSKHTKLIRRASIFYQSLRYYLRVYLFLKISGKKEETFLMRKAVRDFMKNQWGIISCSNGLNKKNSYNSRSLLKSIPKPFFSYKKIIISTVANSRDSIEKMIAFFEENAPKADIHILAKNDRTVFFKRHPIFLIDRSKMKNIVYIFSQFIRLKSGGFDAMACCTPSPFTYATPTAIIFNDNGKIENVIKTDASSFLHLISIIVASELLSVGLLPLLLFKSITYDH